MKKIVILICLSMLLASAASANEIIYSYGGAQENPNLRTQGLYGPVTIDNTGGVLHWQTDGGEGWFEPNARLLVIDPLRSFGRSAQVGVEPGQGHLMGFKPRVNRIYKETAAFPLYYIVDPGQTLLTRGLMYLVNKSDKISAYQAALTAGGNDKICELNKEISSSPDFQIFTNELRRRDRESCRATWLSLAAFFHKPAGGASAFTKSTSTATEWQPNVDHSTPALVVAANVENVTDAEAAMFASDQHQDKKENPKKEDLKKDPKKAVSVLSDIEKLFHLPMNRTATDSVHVGDGEITHGGNHRSGEFYLTGGYNIAAATITERLRLFHSTGNAIFDEVIPAKGDPEEIKK